VPIRGLRTAKTRLSPGLDPAERLALVTEMLRRTLVATRDAESIDGTVVVTLDPAVAGIATAHRAVGLVGYRRLGQWLVGRIDAHYAVGFEVFLPDFQVFASGDDEACMV